MQRPEQNMKVPNRISLPSTKVLKFDQTTPNAMSKQMLASNRFTRPVAIYGSARKQSNEAF
jgi:hypothetical protein